MAKSSSINIRYISENKNIILDPKNWTTKIDRIDVLMVQLEGVRDGSETTEDRVLAEGEGGLGSGAWRSHDERTGVAIRRSSNADRLLEEAVMEGAGELFSDDRRRESQEQEALIADLYEQIGRLQMELAWLKKKLAQLD